MVLAFGLGLALIVNACGDDEDEIDAVGVGVGRRLDVRVQGELARDPAAVEAIAEHESRNDNGGEQGQAHLAAIVV